MTPLLLLHAGVADSRMWQHQVEALSATHQVITPDLRGYGENPVVPKYSDAGDVLALLDDLGLDQVAAVGASYGGYVLQQAASQQPDRFTRLVLLCAPTDNVEPDAALEALWTEEETLIEAGDLEAATELTVQHWIGPDADDAARDLLRTMQRRAFELQIPAGDVDKEDYPVTPETLTMPVRLITGAHDYQFFADSATYLMDRLPNAERKDLPWAGHLPTLERPSEALQLIL
ncbi:alpha/beta hydrolase [Kribbella yunnanensis]|uniref:Alpha/beta hydrolase n=1 Tax=Kribbella yunnanensis TaxID=190194 RepID=A0ABP4U1Z5_9ACTN